MGWWEKWCFQQRMDGSALFEQPTVGGQTAPLSLDPLLLKPSSEFRQKSRPGRTNQPINQQNKQANITILLTQCAPQYSPIIIFYSFLCRLVLHSWHPAPSHY